MRKAELESEVARLSHEVKRLKEDANVTTEGVIWTHLRDLEIPRGEPMKHIANLGLACREAIRSGKVTRDDVLSALGLREHTTEDDSSNVKEGK